MNQQARVIIIGCGPAGAGVSLFLSKAGIHHVILEKDSYPRDKICGDGCSGKTTMVLQRANPGLLREIFSDADRFLPSYGVTFAAPNGKSLDIPFGLNKQRPEYPPGFTSRRLDFDHFLFKQLESPYAHILQQATVLDIVKQPDGYAVTYRTKDNEALQTLQCKLLIGADGDKGISRKKLVQQEQVVKTAAVGLRAYYNGVTGMHPEHFIELHFLPELLPGYFWIFPLPQGRANVGVCMPSAHVRKKKVNLREVMLHTIKHNPNIRERFSQAAPEDKLYGWGLPMSKGKEKVLGDHFMLIGDAASLIDPFTGEGIGNALYSGMLAAEAAIKALAQERFDAAFLQEHYGQPLQQRIGTELQLSYTMQRLVRFPWLFNLVVNKAHKSPALRNTLSGMFENLDMRSLLRKPSFYRDILFNK